MTRDEVMILANKTAGQNWMDEGHIQRFAALVAAAEREACANLVWTTPDSDDDYVTPRQVIADAIRARGADGS